MGNRLIAHCLTTAVLLSWPPHAHAQRIPWTVLPLAASPVVAVLLALALGAATKSWLVGLGNTALVIFWVVWFWVASNSTTSDWLVWMSIAALGLHTLVMVWFIVLHILRRVRTRSGA